MTLSWFNSTVLWRRGNPTLDKSLVLGASTVDQLIQRLEAFESDHHAVNKLAVVLSASKRPPRSVILCFGGQVSTFVGLDRAVFDATKILRTHLKACDAICVSLQEVGSIFSGIFQRIPVQDPVRLQTMLFAMQYACAKSWIDCQVKPV